MMAIKAISKLFANYKPKNVFLVVTHCDLKVPEEELIQGKLASFKNNGNVTIPRDNVILFNNTQESLIPLLEKVKPSNMHFHKNIEEKAGEILKELRGDFKRQDEAERTNNAVQFKYVLDMIKEQNEMLRKSIIDSNN